MSVAWRQVLHPLGPVGAQGLAQAVNLAAQMALIALLGQERFADLGLGLMTAGGVCFLGEIGAGPYFLREAARSPQWLGPWRQSSGRRLMALAAASVLAWVALGWGAPQPDAARMVLLMAVPGIVASAVNPLPLLFGLGKVRTASSGLMGRFLVQGGGSVAAALAWPDAAAAGIGLAFSAGILLQLAVGQWAGLPMAALWPCWPGESPPPATLRLWGLSLLGTLSDRALPFIIGKTRPDILATALIVVQILQTLAGLGAQMDRLLIPASARGDTTGLNWEVLVLPLVAIMAAMPLALTGAAWLLMPGQQWIALLLGLEWAMVLAGALTFALAFARERDGPAVRFMLIGLPISIAAQVAASDSLPLEAILALRVAVAAMVAWLTVRGAGMAESPRHG